MKWLTEDELKKIYSESKTIAVVGISADESKPSNSVPAYLQGQGFRIIPVNPKGGEILGESVYKSLDKIDTPVDVVDVFRPAEETPEIARQAAAIGAKVLWLQEGIVSEEAAKIGEEAGMAVVMDKCMRGTHRQLGLESGA
ncbi:MAG: CoA-binding protein [Actinobacteria bacterium]|nr:CoA-binding protein [Actinomycetota bacterium]